MPVFKKSAHNACPVCGLPRGKGKYEFSHGACAEKRASTEGKKPSKSLIEGKKPFTVEQIEKGRRNAAKRRYLSGKDLPGWMYD